MNCNVRINKNLILSIKTLIDEQIPIISVLANTSRILIDYFNNTNWCGFYLTKENEDVLYLGPYQGTTATMIIPFGKGVCGMSAFLKKSQVVPNVHEYEGHIACSNLSNSEIVVPIIKNNKVVGVIDLDSNLYDNYSSEDAKLLEEVAAILSEKF